ncbi:MAG TPA: carboxypeptidase-like regulatory domain-containing protein [Puia sp.]|nr:carboxypeptidase-like regulatory domain-containing protein [Puia sp.]
MKRKTYLIELLCLIMLLGISAVKGQNRFELKGKITDARTNNPILSASVFIGNSSMGTITDKKGEFTLMNIPGGNYQLTVSCVGYKSLTLKISSNSISENYNLQLQPRIEELDSVIVRASDKHGWEKWGALFKEKFLGNSTISREARIENPQVLQFRHSTSNELDVVATDPLIIENAALGYKIRYELEEFRYYESSQSVSFQGHCYFEELVPPNTRAFKRWTRNRIAAYRGSILHFMRSLFQGTLKQDGFEVRRSVDKGDNYFWVSSNELIADSLLINATDTLKQLYFPNYVDVLYKNAKVDGKYMSLQLVIDVGEGQKSRISLEGKKPLTIEASGNFDPPLELYLMGYWAWSQKIGLLLPLDYQIPKQ